MNRVHLWRACRCISSSSSTSSSSSSIAAAVRWRRFSSFVPLDTTAAAPQVNELVAAALRSTRSSASARNAESRKWGHGGRMPRVNSLLHSSINSILRTRVSDQLVMHAQVVVTNVETSRDLGIAKCYFSFSMDALQHQHHHHHSSNNSSSTAHREIKSSNSSIGPAEDGDKMVAVENKEASARQPDEEGVLGADRKRPHAPRFLGKDMEQAGLWVEHYLNTHLSAFVRRKVSESSGLARVPRLHFVVDETRSQMAAVETTLNLIRFADSPRS
ncbi:mitochondrial ribosome-binding factor A (RbfA) [Andalucia godoyi]|uniref:Mitochondrial ribosome-binding factor A (RbfA) n=1 Tax=Andalucia godoyi TaxID=505711 RepID=A0A8K0AK08_ANDGO|nr:mitochondrial ribosome-binding factor A (RbfA) [Andalucia godoyi]|eukprot:ANDGO_06616.mRNA.1 mitochondrial ribosome-binding factor A (RbfA)